MTAPVLELENLSIEVAPASEAPRRIAADVSLTMQRGRTLALVGESGCGKTVTGLACLNLLAPPLRISAGAVWLRDAEPEQDLAVASPQALAAVRGRRIGMIFQDPMTALDPVFPVGEQIAETLRLHLGLSRKAAADRAVELLRIVGIPAPAMRARDYPFQLSGGMRQRVMIASAIACSPAVLIADEPTTALDVTVQAQILDLLRELAEGMGMATLLITHDLGVVAENAHEVAVMYRGHIVERAAVDALFAGPAHPYTQGLLASLPPDDGRSRLTPIPGQVRPPDASEPGCPFADRCSSAMAVCRDRMPRFISIARAHQVACWLHASP